MHTRPRGRLRDLDRIATEALKRAPRRNLKRVDRDLTLHAIEVSTEPRADS